MSKVEKLAVLGKLALKILMLSYQIFFTYNTYHFLLYNINTIGEMVKGIITPLRCSILYR